MDLATESERVFRTLSVGQQQRVALARAIAQLDPGGVGSSGRSGCLVLDEPTSAMDLLHVHQVTQMLRELATAGAAIIVAMHDLARVAAFADDVWLLHRGRLVAAGPAGEVMQPASLEAIFGVRFEQVLTGDGRTVLMPQLRVAGARA
jgi:iron complex transport system ATP-binding protein